MNLEDVRGKREQFLIALYELSDGDANKEVDSRDLAGCLRIDYDEEAPRIARYWRGQKMVSWAFFDRIWQTPLGQAKAKELIEANEQQIAPTNTASNASAVETMKCPQCSHDIAVTARFCESCGTGLEKFNAPTLERFMSGQIATAITDSWINQVVGAKYLVGEKLGEGNIGAVYRARRTDISLEVAIKLLHAKNLTDQKAIDRFKREAEAASKIRHQNVVSILDFGAGDANSPAFIVMELIVGDSLDKILNDEKKLDPHRAVSIMREICKGVGAGHKQNILHRDLKPANIMVIKPDEDDEAERIKVLDFGLAKLLDTGVDFDLTEAGAVMGTPFYMSPEQCLGESLAPSSDVYSLGVLLYEMIAGSRPFEASEFSALSRQHINKTPPPFSDHLNLSEALARIIMRALSKKRDERPSDASAFGLELKNVSEYETVALIMAQEDEISRPAIRLVEEAEEVETINVLDLPDHLVLKASCNKAVNMGRLKRIPATDVVKELAGQLSTDEVIDSLEILSDRGYLQLSDKKGCNLRICQFEITPWGFDLYAGHCVLGYKAKHDSVVLDIVRRKKDVFDKPDMMTEFILDKLASEGSLQIAKFHGGKIKIMHVSAQLKRRYKNVDEPIVEVVEKEPRPDSLAAKAATLAEKVRYKQERESWSRSENGRKDAQDEVRRLFDELLRRAKEISDQGIEIQTATDGEECILRWRGLSLLASWNPGRIVNTLEGTGLSIRLSVSQPAHIVNQFVSEKQDLLSLRYDIDIGPNGEIGWRQSKSRQEVLASAKVADIWVGYFINEVERKLASG